MSTHIQTCVSLIVIALVPASALADSPQKLYYLGEAKLSSAGGKLLATEVFLLEKTLDRERATIIERPVIVKQDGNVEEWTLRFAIKDDNTFTLTEESKKVEGNGKLFGPAWKWTYFKATYKTAAGMQIEDENFMADDSVGTARQKIIGPDNKILMYRDISFKAISPKTYEILRAGLIKK